MRRNPSRFNEPLPSTRIGSALLLVLVVVSVLTLVTFTFARSMFTERLAAQMQGRGLQSLALAESGREFVTRFLMQPLEIQEEAGGIYDNPERFQGVLVVDADDAVDRGRFSVVVPNTIDPSEGGLRFGLEDESARVNLNTILLADDQQENGSRELLMALPGMTEEVADAILDWIDEDDETRPFGAEVDYYSGLSPPYAPMNGPLETVEQLLLVRGVTPELLFGPDANRNGMLDAHEPAGESVAGVDNSSGELNRGWSGFFTLHSVEANVQDDGSPKIDLNSDDLEQLYDDLKAALGTQQATFIVAFRQYGPYAGSGEGQRSVDLDLKQPGRVPLSTVLDLIGPRVRVVTSDGESTILESPFPALPPAMALYLPTLMEKTTVNPSPTIPGRININQASRTVLRGIPGMTDDLVEAIITRRQPEPSREQSNHRYETWLLVEGLVELEQMKGLMPFVTGGGHAYRAQVVGYFDEKGPSSRIEMILDATQAVPRLVSWRDISHLGRGYALGTLGTQVDE